MGVFLIFITAALIGASDLPVTLAKFSAPLHKLCVDRYANSTQRNLHAAIICGAELPLGETHETFRKTGLIHLIVVSGSHLLWLEFVLRKLLFRFPKSEIVVIALLTLFTFASRLEPPILRAAFSMALGAADRRWSLGWTPLHRTLFSGVICLCLYPLWFGSASLLLSWAAALVLAVHRPSSSVWRTQSVLYVVLFLCLLPFSPPHPITIAFNVLFAPLVAGLLFPLSIIVGGAPASAEIIDPIVAAALRFMGSLAEEIPEFSHPFRIPPTALWIYIFALQIYWLRKQIIERRSNSCVR